jgi:alkanesulfonate monooxygenase SsuD/methylene tetrahydromethanopterin reductase-like flavin-dependent oxidoreductase (luciferase family)
MAVTLRIGYGPVTVQRHPDSDVSWPRIYADNLAMVAHAEELGFESVWVSEHHFADDGYLSAAFPLLAAIAARTETVLIGSRVIVAPLHHPLRLAEDAAAVSALSNGRLILGLSAGYRQLEFDALTGSMHHRAARLENAVDTCRRAWTGKPFDELIMFPDAEIPVWLGGRAPAALARTGAMADGFVAPAGTAAELGDLLRRVDEVAAGRGPLPVSVSAYVALDGCAGVSRGIDRMFAGYAGMTGRENTASQVGRPAAREAMVAGGDPAQVAERLARFVTAAGPDRVLDLAVRLEYPGMAREEVFRHMDLFAKQVMPRLRG